MGSKRKPGYADATTLIEMPLPEIDARTRALIEAEQQAIQNEEGLRALARAKTLPRGAMHLPMIVPEVDTLPGVRAISASTFRRPEQQAMRSIRGDYTPPAGIRVAIPIPQALNDAPRRAIPLPPPQPEPEHEAPLVRQPITPPAPQPPIQRAPKSSPRAKKIERSPSLAQRLALIALAIVVASGILTYAASTLNPAKAQTKVAITR